MVSSSLTELGKLLLWGGTFGLSSSVSTAGRLHAINKQRKKYLGWPIGLFVFSEVIKESIAGSYQRRLFVNIKGNIRLGFL